VHVDVAGAFEPLQDEPFAAEEARAQAFGERDVDVDGPGRAQEGVALAENRAVLQRKPQDLPGVRRAERDARAWSRRAEEGQEEALAGQELTLEAGQQAALHAGVHLDPLGHEGHRPRLGPDFVARAKRQDDRLHVVAHDFVRNH
jgi:hypothetical protein